MTALTIGQCARKAQVNVDTIGYYERRGLIPEPPRRQSGFSAAAILVEEILRCYISREIIPCGKTCLC